MITNNNLIIRYLKSVPLQVSLQKIKLDFEVAKKNMLIFIILIKFSLQVSLQKFKLRSLFCFLFKNLNLNSLRYEQSNHLLSGHWRLPLARRETRRY